MGTYHSPVCRLASVIKCHEGDEGGRLVHEVHHERHGRVERKGLKQKEIKFFH